MPYESPVNSNPCNDLENDDQSSGVAGGDGVNLNGQINPELNDASTVLGADGDAFENYESEYSSAQSRTGNILNFLVPTLQLNVETPSAFREKIIINQELFYNGIRYNDLEYSLYRKEGQQYYYHPSSSPAALAQDDTKYIP